MKMEQTEVVISDTGSRQLKASVDPKTNNVFITRLWRDPFKVSTIGVSLTELETILKRFNGGEKSG